MSFTYLENYMYVYGNEENIIESIWDKYTTLK